jgi:hypothetical protein
MWWKASCGVVAAAVCLAGCGSERERERSDSPAAQVVRDFYEAANDADGQEACALLTDAGIRTVVRVKSRAECVGTVGAFQRGSLEVENGELVEIEGVAQGEDGFDVDAVITGRTEGTYTVVRRNGRLLIDGFASKEG